MGVRYRALIDGEQFSNRNRCYFRRRGDLINALKSSDLWTQKLYDLKNSLYKQYNYLPYSKYLEQSESMFNEWMNNHIVIQEINY